MKLIVQRKSGALKTNRDERTSARENFHTHTHPQTQFNIIFASALSIYTYNLSSIPVAAKSHENDDNSDSITSDYRFTKC